MTEIWIRNKCRISESNSPDSRTDDNQGRRSTENIPGHSIMDDLHDRPTRHIEKNRFFYFI